MDINYLLFLQRVRLALGGAFDGFFLAVTQLGSGIVTWLVLGFVYWCVSKRTGQRMAWNVGIACSLNQMAKRFFRVERPWVRDARVTPVEGALADAGGYSFPSGHTQRAMAVWGAAGAAAWKKGAGVKDTDVKSADQGTERNVELKTGHLLSLLCFVIVLLVAFSRNYLGVHTFQDVAVALLVGAVLIVLLDKALDWAEHGKNRDLVLAAIGCLICFLPMLRYGCLSNAGAGMGICIAWVLERRFVDFPVAGTKAERALRFAVGGAGILVIETVLNDTLKLFFEAKYAGFFTSFALAMFIMVVYPFFFSKRERFKAGVAATIVICILLLGLSYAGVHGASVGILFGRGNDAAAASAGADSTVDGVEYDGASETGSSTAGAGTLDGNSSDAAQALTHVSEDEIAIIAHRGYSEVYPENTLASFAGALDIDADYIELDVQLSSDGEVIVLHDDTLERTTGQAGVPADYTMSELSAMDVGSWFDASFADEGIPTLAEVLELVAPSDTDIYLELKDIGDVDGFEEKVLAVADAAGMTDRCLFASFRYEYLPTFKELDPEAKTLFITTSGETSLPKDYPADYYGLYAQTVTSETVAAVHAAGAKAFVWTVDAPAEMVRLKDMGIDGICTNKAGLAKVCVHSEYSYLAENYVLSFPLPGLYGANLPEICENAVVQGLTKAGDYTVISAYSKAGENSILYLVDGDGKLERIVDLGFVAHVGGTSYEEKRDILWITGAEGDVYALSWAAIADGSYSGELLASFPAGLTNQTGAKVASFLTFFEGRLYVGSYVDGAAGRLRCFDVSDLASPSLLSEVEIPERIQGVTFSRNPNSGECTMYLSQGYETLDAALLTYLYTEGQEAYDEPLSSFTLPEGAEQIQMTEEGLYILFESAARPYRETARVVNDHVWVVN